MNTPPATNSRRDNLVTAIGVLVLLLGTATGNAIVMLGLSVVALVVIAVFYRKTIGGPLMLVGAGTIAAIACILLAIR